MNNVDQPPVETRLYKWVHGVYEGFQVIGCMLLQSPFDGVVVEFSDIQLDDDGYTFQWRLLEIPGHTTEPLTLENTAFTKYLERIVNDRLSELQKVECNGANNQTKSDDTGGIN